MTQCFKRIGTMTILSKLSWMELAAWAARYAQMYGEVEIIVSRNGATYYADAPCHHE